MHRHVVAFAALPFLVAASSPPRDAPETAAGSRDKIVCKRFVETGSLVKGYRTCKTKWEWERERENLRTFGVSDSCRNRAEPDPTKPSGGGCSL